MPSIPRSAPIYLRTIAIACLLVGWAAFATAQPTVIVRDTFTGTNGVLLDAHPPDLGGPWVTSRTADLPNWGAGADLPVPGDYDGDGRTDPAVFRPSTGYWFILLSSGNYSYGATMVIPWGVSTDLPTPGDYDGDHKTDIAIYRPSTGYRWILTSSSNFTSSFTVAWGISTDVPVMGDFDGDHSTDIVIYRPSTGQ